MPGILKGAHRAKARRFQPQLEMLEERIDDCLSMAKGMDRAPLEEVIRHLRHARNMVVWKLGEK